MEYDHYHESSFFDCCFVDDVFDQRIPQNPIQKMFSSMESLACKKIWMENWKRTAQKDEY